MDGVVVLVGQTDENVKEINKEAIGFAPVLLTNGCDGFTWEIMIGSGGAS